MSYLPTLLLLFHLFLLHDPSQTLRTWATLTTDGTELCKADQLPGDVRKQLLDEFSPWKIPEAGDLETVTRERWESEKPLQCPGLAIGKFEHEKALSYAVLLVPRDNRSRGYRFVVFNPKIGTAAYSRRIIEHSDEGTTKTFFIREVKVSKFFDEASKKKFHVQAPECILMVDAGKDEYEADVFFLSGETYRKEFVDY